MKETEKKFPTHKALIALAAIVVAAIFIGVLLRSRGNRSTSDSDKVATQAGPNDPSPATTPEDSNPEENRDCPTPGMTLRWKMAFCMAREGTDDLESAGASACMNDTTVNPPASSDACAKNLFWKSRICQLTHGVKAEAEACIKDPDFIPEAVSYGLQGEGE